MARKKAAKDRKPGGYERIAVYSPDDILPLATREEIQLEFNGYWVWMNSQRYEVFQQSRICVICGLEGTFMALERNFHNPPERAHFNLYGIDAEGKEVLFTKDHIIPRSKGGISFITNYQTMCMRCNVEKDDK